MDKTDLIPKLLTSLRSGYGLSSLRADLVAGLTVAVVALPLAMAFAIASGTTPDRGLFTAVVAGFLVSALGGSRHQIGGPTGAFVVVVFGIIHQHGYDGLVISTLMAGVILVVAGLSGLGRAVRLVPAPVVIGFTAGIAVIILSTQIKDLLGLTFGQAPATPLETWHQILRSLHSLQPAVMLVSAIALVTIVVLRRLCPKWPALLIAVVVAALAGLALGALGHGIDTIGTRFGGIPDTLPAPALPVITWARMLDLVPSALTIAFLAGLESLLSAVVADAQGGGHHRPGVELVAQGVANMASVIFGGIPATGAIARTATNIRAGAVSPVAGMLHAMFLLIFMWLLAPLASAIPLGALAAVLVVVAWNMGEAHHIVRMARRPDRDLVVLLTTLALTVLADITWAVVIGTALAFAFRLIRRPV